MTDDGGSTGKQESYLGCTGCLSNKDCQGTLPHINKPYGDPCLGAQLTESVGGTHVPIPNLPNVNALENMPGNIGSGNGTEEVTQYYD